MSSLKKLYIVFTVLFLALVGAIACQMEDTDPYHRRILKYRYTKDSLYKLDPSSPIQRSERVQFYGLSYYKPDSNYRVVAQVNRISPPRPFTLMMSNGSSEQYLKVAELKFKLNGQEFQLTGIQPQEFKSEEQKRYLELMFTDLTNNKTSYHGGRYIEVEYTQGNQVIIDFNYAYNPWCAYSNNSYCPIPPIENKLNTEVSVGERKYEMSSKMN
ncbi:MAG: DUF1684 domain-containing protein [Bacteroidota bacterium]|nr:DUF1684 domain-containing protein [Bacteroidota bacterium]